ncbi:MATE family efflux transporter [Gemmiger sp.]
MNAQNTQELTQGSLPRRLAALAMPLALGNILQEFYNTADAFVIGRFAGQDEFAAIGVAGTVMNLFLFVLVGCCTGFSVLFARAYGQNDRDALHRQETAALAAGFLCTAVLMGLGFGGMQPLLTLLQTPQSLQGYVAVYLRRIFAGLPAAFLYNLFSALLRSSGDTRAALAVLAASVAANLALDFLFVAGLSGGIAGAAAATVLTQVFSALVCYGYLRRAHKELLLSKADLRIDFPHLCTMLQFGLVTGLHQCSLYLGKMLVQGAVNTAGTEVIAAYTAATRIEGFANSVGSSTSSATSILTAQNFGAGKTDRVKGTFRCSICCTAALGAVSAVGMFALAPYAVPLLLGSHEGIAFAQGVRYLRMVSLFYVLCFTGNTFTGYYDGIGKVMLPFLGALGHISIRVVLSWLLFPYLGLNAVAVATGIGWLCGNLFWAVCLKPAARGR